MAQVRYIVSDVDRAVTFYVDRLGFAVVQDFRPAIAILEQGDLRLWVAGPTASASRPMPDGAQPIPGGGWGRFVLTVEDLPAMVERLQGEGVTFRNTIVKGPGGQQILVQDPDGNLVELFEPG